MLVDPEHAAQWRWLPAGSPVANLVVDLRAGARRRDLPVPDEWHATDGYASESLDWRLDAMAVPDPHGQGSHGFLRFNRADGFRFVVAVHRDSGTAHSLPNGVLAAAMPSLRRVLVSDSGALHGCGAQAVQDTREPTGAWEYHLGGLALAVQHPHRWFGLPVPTPERARAGFHVSMTQATTLLAWSLINIGAEEAACWSAVGFSPPDVGKWTHPRKKDPWTPFSVDAAREWVSVVGVKNPKTADTWRRAGFTPAEARHWRRVLGHAPFTTLSATEIKHWATVSDPERRHAYMSARMTAEEAATHEASASPPTVEQLNLLVALSGHPLEPRPR